MPKPATLPLNLILLGDPAAGKATQAALLAKKFHMYDFDMGKEIAHLGKKDKQVDRAVKDYQDRGKLTPTWVARKILRDTIRHVPSNQGILFDGHPKMLGEAKIASNLLKKVSRPDPLVIYISISLDETVKRIQGRQGYFRGKFSKRADDSDEGLKNRARYYRKNIAEVVNFFQSKYRFEKISGRGTQAQVHKRIMAEVKKFLNKK
jgi:adenylate kinase